jgi:hypothetical protein
VFLDKELEPILREAEVGKQILDKLARVTLLDVYNPPGGLKPIGSLEKCFFDMGEVKGLKEVIVRGLKRRFGEAGLGLLPRVNEIADAEPLHLLTVVVHFGG